MPSTSISMMKTARPPKTAPSTSGRAWFALISCFSWMMTVPHAFQRVTAAVALTLVVGATAHAQTSDDLFNPDALQRVELWLNEQDWAKLQQNFQENTYYPADLTWNGQTVPNVGIRSRGLGSRSSTKPGLRVDFDRYASGQHFLGLKSLVLDNLTQD